MSGRNNGWEIIFEREIFPVVTPMAVDSSHPFRSLHPKV